MMRDIDAWPRGSSLGQYAELFRTSDIEAGLRPRLTGDDLKDMGVISPGHRKKLWEAIAALGAATNEPSPPRVAAGPRLVRSGLRCAIGGGRTDDG